jgi:site-specific recombinase XerD/transcription elongation factor Elf1
VRWRQETVRNQTIRRELQALHRGLTDAKRRGWVTDIPDPWPRLAKSTPHPRMKGKLHSEQDIQKVVDELPAAAIDGVIFGLATGVRLEELRRVRWSNIRTLANNEAAVGLLVLPDTDTKTRKERYLGLNQEAYDIAKRRSEVYGDVIFPKYDYTQALKRTAKRLKLPPMNFRDMRHTYASTALRVSGGNLSAVAKAMGHSELEITTLYLHAREQDVINLAATVITPNRSHHTTRKAPGRVSTQEQREKVARSEGVEPTTFGFGDRPNTDFAGFYGAQAEKPRLENAGKCLRCDHTKRSHQEYPRILVFCGACKREQDQEQAPTYECLFCGSTAVVSLINPEDVVEIRSDRC